MPLNVRSSLRILAATARRGAATVAGATLPPLPPPPPPSGAPNNFFELAKQFQPLLGMLTGAVVIGGFITAAGYRNDVIASRLEERMNGLENSLASQMSGLEGKLGEKVNGLEGKVNATMAGVMSGAADKAKAATLEVLKDYKISVAGGEASKSQ